MKRIINKLFWVVPVLVSTTLAARQPDIIPGSNIKAKRQNLKAAVCAPATQIASLEFNNVRARIENGGNMWQDRTKGVAGYEVPKGGGIRSLFAGALWMGGQSQNETLKLAAVTFRTGNDFWPGPLRTGVAETDPQTCADWDRFYHAFKADAIRHDLYFKAKAEGAEKVKELFPEGYEESGPEYFQDWPWKGIPGGDAQVAPYVDKNEDGQYDPTDGDYPGYDLFGGPRDCRAATRNVPLFGDTTIYWVFNDKGATHSETNSEPIGMEVRAQAFAFSDRNAINNMTFYNYVLINQGSQVLYNTYFGQWADADLGNSNDDYVGCDVSRGLGYAYNGDNNDDVNGGPAPGYGATPPAVGIDFFQGPFQDPDGLDNIGPYDSLLAPFGRKDPISYQEATAGLGIPYAGLGIGYGDSVPDNERFGMRKFLYYNIGGGPIGDPSTATDYYNYLRGIWRDNQPFVFGGDAHAPGTAGLGCPTGPTSLSAYCDFMFPGNTDPLLFGSRGIDYSCNWTEATAGNQQGDRRFMQSAGPFTLTPGQVNNITVGVVWARAQTGDAISSVDDLKKADDLAQGLFDNCFQLFEGPDAPDVNITELDREVIIALSNPASSNNYNEAYKKQRPEIPNGFDKEYKFEGYMVYQCANAQVTLADIGNQTKIKQIFQCDIRNFLKDSSGNDILSKPISDLINYVQDPVMKKPIPTNMMVERPAANGGITRAIKITEDAFSIDRNKQLINNKPYYFIAIAYGYNNYADYKTEALTGQPEPFVSSRKNGRAGAIQSVTAIPHIIAPQDGGTVINSYFDQGLVVKRLSGAGNGGNFVELDPFTEAEILRDTVAYELKYKAGASPINAKVVDPLKVRNTEWQLRFVPDTLNSTDQATWILSEQPTGETYKSDKTIKIGGEQLILSEGISLTVNQVYYYPEGTNEKTDPLINPPSSIEFEGNPNNKWLSGIQDLDGPSAQNWIRAGKVQGTPGLEDYKGNSDVTQVYENVLGGTWTAFALVSDTVGGGLNPDASETARSQKPTELARTTSVDVVLTSNRDLWTRCPVLEMQEDTSLSQNRTTKGRPRKVLSVDKFGKNILQGGIVDQCNLVSDSGMGWFPGYAINVETGERLNMAFGEDSWLTGENGRDMVWNPSSTIGRGFGPNRELVLGGKHYIYVFKNDRRGRNDIKDVQTNTTHMPRYDNGRFAMTCFNTQGTPNQIKLQVKKVWNAGNWVGLPLLTPGYNYKSLQDGLIPSTVRIKLRVNKPYTRYPVGKDVAGVPYSISDSTGVAEYQAKNKWFPLYTLSSHGYAAEKNRHDIAVNALEIVRAVPNPYYAYSSYEMNNRLDNRIKITNLPQTCTIGIYTIDGTLVRQFKKDNSLTFIEWDLKNFANIPISSGAYLIHVNAPGIGEKVIKWFGVMRQVDLYNL